GGTVTASGAVTWVGKLPNVPVSLSGLWRLEIGGGDTVGAFSVVLKGADTLKVASSKTTPPTIPQSGQTDVSIEAGENVALTVTAKRAKGSTVSPQLTIFDSTGQQLTASTVPTLVNAKAGSVTLKGYRLPVFGKYTLRFKGAGNGGGQFT